MLESLGLMKKGQLFVEQACAFHLQVLLASAQYKSIIWKNLTDFLCLVNMAK
jgi:hypothetical protein